MARFTLDEILSSEDHDGLLDVKLTAPTENPSEVRLRQDFEEVNLFIEQHGRVPGEIASEQRIPVKERLLELRLQGYRKSPVATNFLRHHDRHGVLGSDGAEDNVGSLEDILGSDDPLLTTDDHDIFTMRHARPKAARPDRVSERKQAKDFADFKPLFDACIADLVSGRRKSLRFANEQEISAGEFFILNGVMVYVAEVNDPHVRNRKRNARLRLIFENGTEGENLLRSLATELYKDPSGRRISNPTAGALFDNQAFVAKAQPSSGDRSGLIYVVRSLSSEPAVAALTGQLYKIGFTTGGLDERIRNAEKDPTFLFAPVQPVRTYTAYDMNISKFETLLHRFFDVARWDIELPDRFGRTFRPKEWFAVPIEVVDMVMPMFLDGSILRYRYDPASGSVVEKPFAE